MDTNSLMEKLARAAYEKGSFNGTWLYAENGQIVSKGAYGWRDAESKLPMREDTVFGPIRSRRLGSSLGVNLLPRNGKLCNFDCIYCECGWNKDGLGDRILPDVREVEEALK